MKQVENLRLATPYAAAIGLPFTRMITIHWQAAGIPLEAMPKATGRFIDLLTKALTRRGSRTAWLCCHESCGRKGGHCHLLAHVPVPHVPTVVALQRGWLRRITGVPYRCKVIRSTPIGGRLGLEKRNPELHAINLEAALSYVLKGASEQAAARFNLHRLEPGGSVIGKTLRHVPEHWSEGQEGSHLMTKAKAKVADGLVKAGEPDNLEIKASDHEPAGRTLARVTLDPITRNANLAASFGAQVFGDRHRASIMETAAVLDEEVAKTNKGERGLASRILTCQAVSLDSFFSEMARRAGNKYPDAAERYMRVAPKAQSNCRTTLEALAKLHQPREQTVRHVHVNEGGQAIVADQFHQHTGGRGNAESAEQSDATGSAGDRAPLPCPDPLGNGVPVSGGKREAAMQDARRDECRRA